MPCTPIKLKDGTVVIVHHTNRKRVCRFCFNEAQFLCDFPSGRGTCDAPVCLGHAKPTGVDQHYCKDHWFAKPVVQGKLFDAKPQT
jgi:hypothetical protein